MFGASKPITKPFIGINPPIIEDVLGDELVKENKYQEIADQIDMHEYKYK